MKKQNQILVDVSERINEDKYILVEEKFGDWEYAQEELKTLVSIF